MSAPRALLLVLVLGGCKLGLNVGAVVPQPTPVINVEPPDAGPDARGGFDLVPDLAPDQRPVPGDLVSDVTDAARAPDTSPPALVITPVGTGTANVLVGSRASIAFRVRNAGGMSTGPLVITLTGGEQVDGSSFSLRADGSDCEGRSLAPDADCGVAISFAPTRGDVHDGTLSASFGANTQKRALRAIGLTVLLGGAPSFRPTSTGTSCEIAETIELRNPAAEPIVAISARFTPDAHFRVLGGCEASIPGGQACVLLVAFKPRAVGTHQAELDVLGLPGGTAFAPVRGRATPSVSLDLDPSLPVFDAAMGTDMQSVIVTNVSDKPLTLAPFPIGDNPRVVQLESQRIAPPRPTRFMIIGESCTNATLPACGGRCEVRVRFGGATAMAGVTDRLLVTPMGIESTSTALTGIPR